MYFKLINDTHGHAAGDLLLRELGHRISSCLREITASIGVVMFINHEASDKDILDRADKAMYQAKAAGRNLIRFYAA